DAASAPKFVPAGDSIVWMIFSAMSLVVLAGITAFARVLKSDRDWSFADAMSGPDGKPSTSRIIAFLGFLVMIAIILGIGYSSIWAFLQTGQLPIFGRGIDFPSRLRSAVRSILRESIRACHWGTIVHSTEYCPRGCAE